MADVRISELPAAGALTGTEQVVMVQGGVTVRASSDAIADLNPAGVTDHGALTGLADDDHTQYHTDARGDARYPPLARNLVAGAGLTGGGTLAADRTLAVGAGTGITVNADDVALDVASARNADHSAISITAGAGLTGGGNLTASRTLSVPDNGITLAMLADIATASFLGRTTAAAGDPEVLSVLQATALLNTFTSGLKGLAPPSGGGTTNFLRADGTWTSPPGSGVTDHGALTGLVDDDHGHYHTDARGDARYYTQGQLNAGQLDGRYYTESEANALFAVVSHTHPSTAISDSTATGRAMLQAVSSAAQTALLDTFTSALKGLTPPSGGGTSNYLRADGTWAVPPGAGVSDHGGLSGLADDDHTQYHTDARGDARYYTQAQLNAGQLDNRYYTEAEANDLIGAKQNFDSTLLALAQLNATAGLLEQTGADTFTKRAMGVGATTSIPTRADADARYAAISHVHASTDITDMTVAGRSMIQAANAAAQTSLLDLFTTTLKGLVPPSSGGSVNFLRADGVWGAPPSTAFNGAVVSRSASVTALSGASTTLGWDAENLDVGSWFSFGAPTRLTVPSGVGYVEIKAEITVNTGDAGTYCNLRLNIFRNGSTVAQSFLDCPPSAASLEYNTISCELLLAVSPGDYFEAAIFIDSTPFSIPFSVLGTNNRTKFTIRAVGN